MRWIAPLVLSLGAQAALSQVSETVGDVRVQFLSPHLVRLEAKGPKGFEDRPTFHIVGRTGWPGVKYKRKPLPGTVQFVSPKWTVEIPRRASGLKGVRILSGGTLAYSFDGKPSNSAWLPAPGSVPKAWSIADTPRVVPSKYGLTPSGDGDPNSGWDLGNDADDIYVFLPEGSYQVLRADFLRLTGPVEMPPLYALGYTDSRYYAYEQNEALARIDEYRRRRIPLDTFVIDTDWRLGGSHGYKVDSKYFPDMPTFLKGAHQRHARIMFNDHPEPQAQTALDPAEIDYRFKGLGGLLKQGVDIWWYDRNWNVGLVPPAPHLARETWGMKLYHDVTARVRPSERPLIMANVDGIDNGIRNRPPNIAAHRYPVQWTGDTRSQWIFLRRGVENAVFEGVMGLNPWVNEDLGGHVGMPDPDLYIRFLQFGSICPFMRVHATKGNTREPWVFGPDAERIVPEYIKMRYRLMPMLYSSAREAFETGEPLLRRLDLQYPGFEQAAANDQFLIGDSLLVAPIVGGKEAAVVPTSAFPTGLAAEYYATKDLSGTPSTRATAKNLDFNWGQGAPDPQLPKDNFSARWSGQISIPKDRPYRLSVTADDGVRLWIDGKLAVDKWIPQDSVTTEAPVDLEPGSTHDLKVEYMELSSDAICRLRWRQVTPTSDETQRSCWFPPGVWTDVWTGRTYTGPAKKTISAPLDQMPMYLRQGSIIPLGPDVQWTGEKDWASMVLDVVPGDGSFTLYEDDGHSIEYANGAFRKTSITVKKQGRGHKITIAPAEGDFKGALAKRSWNLRIFAPSLKEVRVDGKVVKLRRVAKGSAHPFSLSGGSQMGSLFEVAIPTSSVRTRHSVDFR